MKKKLIRVVSATNLQSINERHIEFTYERKSDLAQMLLGVAPMVCFIVTTEKTTGLAGYLLGAYIYFLCVYIYDRYLVRHRLLIFSYFLWPIFSGIAVVSALTRLFTSLRCERMHWIALFIDKRNLFLKKVFE